MRVLIQRVKRASVTVDGELVSEIGKGLLVFVGICDNDGKEDIEWLTKKISNIRLFDDENGVMNLRVENGRVIHYFIVGHKFKKRANVHNS